MLWHQTHRDVRSQPLGYDELWERTVAYAEAIKKADPGSKVAGFCSWGWTDLSGAVPDADDMVQVSVTDTGPGLDADVASQLFQPFVSTKAGGMGLGLSICQTIVEAHGGRIWLDCPAGGGTIFRFTLVASHQETDHDH